jgi:hypothetical protein
VTEAPARPDAHLAQFNIATLVAAVDDPRVAEFADNLDRINALGDTSPGFVWRLQTEEGDATAVRAYDLAAGDPRPYAFTFARPFDAVVVDEPLDSETAAPA